MSKKLKGHVPAGTTVSILSAAFILLAAILLSASPSTGDASTAKTGPVAKADVATKRSRPATVPRLTGKKFVSTSIRGKKFGKVRIRMSFFRAPSFPSPDGSDGKLVPTVSTHAGCNSIGGEYRIRKGRLRWKNVVLTAMRCPHQGRDLWLIRILKRGVKARFVGKRLVFKRGKNVRIVLRRVAKK